MFQRGRVEKRLKSWSVDEIPKDQVRAFEAAFHAFLEERYPDTLHEIQKTNELSDEIAKRLDEAAIQCTQQFLSSSQR